jgi:hypothetical protein
MIAPAVASLNSAVSSNRSRKELLRADEERRDQPVSVRDLERSLAIQSRNLKMPIGSRSTCWRAQTLRPCP